jgi:prepilin-type processing-associated H-X9-DG protein
MYTRVLVALLVLVTLSASALAQGPPAADAPAAPLDPVELMRQMGAEKEELLQFQLFSQVLGPEATPLLLLMLMDGGGMDDGMLPFMLMMKAAGGKGAGAPAVAMHGERLYIVEDGTVYIINTTTAQVEGSIAYRPAAQAGGLPQDLLPMLQQAREKAVGQSCLSNMKQLCLAAMMYTQDWDETLPGETWVEQVEPYHKNAAILACPGVPDRAHGYALNEALAGARMADIKRPAETVLFFETDLPDDLPFGGPDGLPQEPRHGGRVVLGFVDGHAQMCSLEEARKLLEQDPFE